MLLATLVLLRKSLRDLDAIAPKLRQLGARHVGYGARPEHYPVVAEVLLASMAEIAGNAWTTELTAAWAGALGVVAAAMLEGAEEAEAARKPARPRIQAPTRSERKGRSRAALRLGAGSRTARHQVARFPEAAAAGNLREVKPRGRKK
jgi:hypothetical protein